MSSSSISAIGRASLQPHVTPAPGSTNVSASPAPPRPPAPPRSRSGGPLNRFQSFSANQSTRTQTEAAVAHATPAASVTAAAVVTTTEVRNEPEAATTHTSSPSPIDAFRAQVRGIAFSMPPLQQRIAELGNLVEACTTFLHEQGTLRIVGRDELIEHVARDMEAGDQAAAHGQGLAAARAYIDTSLASGFAARHLDGAPIHVLAGADGSHFARREVLRLLSAHEGRTEIERENNDADLDEALAEAVTRLIERERGVDVPNAHPHAYRAAAGMLLGLADASEGGKRGMLQAYVQGGGEKTLVDAMAAHREARAGHNQSVDDASAHALMAGVLRKTVGALRGHVSLQQAIGGCVAPTMPKRDADPGTRFAR
jgi:hypothetical protein